MTWKPGLVREARRLLVDASYLDTDVLNRLEEEHQFTEHHAGDGYTEPRESWIDCSCDATVWAWQQYYMETQEDPETAKKLHLAFALCEEIIKRDKETKDA